MSTRHVAAEGAHLSDLTPEGSSGRASKRFRQKLAADGFTVDEGFRLKPGYLYTVVRAISARVNQNYDGWPSEELKKSYKTFIGKPVFVNHENHDPTKARGVVVASRYVENGADRYIEVVQEVDAERFPKLAHEIKTGGLDSVSMGAEAGFTICSYCHNKATDLHDMCDHVKNHKGKTLTKFDRRTGKKEDILVFESCHKISFFELSYVFEPADETAVASKVVVAATARPETPNNSQKWYRPRNKSLNDNKRRWAPDVESGDGWEPVEQERDPFDPRSYTAGKYTKEDFANAGGKKPWETESDDEDSAAEIEIHAMFHTAGGICPPGQPCVNRMPEGEQIHKDSPNNPVNWPDAGGGGAAGGAGGSVGGTAGSSPSKFDISQWKSADDYAKSMSGKPYNYSGAAGDPKGVDCSGYMSDIYSIYSGKPTRFTTDSNFADLGFQPGYKPGAFNIGTNGGSGENGHMAGTLPDGTNVESNGSAGVQYGGAAAGATDGQFSQQWHYPVSTPTAGSQPAQRAANLRGWIDEIDRLHRVIRTADLDVIPQNSQNTQRPGTINTYRKVHDFFDAVGAPNEGGSEGVLDYGSGLGHSGRWGHTYEPHPDVAPGAGNYPSWVDPNEVPEGKFNRVTNVHVLNVVPPDIRDQIVDGVKGAMAPGGHAVFVTRSKSDVDSTKHKVDANNGDPGAYHVFDPEKPEERTYQKGFTPQELHQYISDRMGPGHTVTLIPGKNKISAPAVHVIKHAAAPEGRVSRRTVRSAALKKIARNNVRKRLAWGETEAPMAVDTLREEGSAPEDDDDDFEQYVKSPDDLRTPDLSQAGQVDRQQEIAGAPTDTTGGVPGAAEPGAQAPMPSQQPQQQFMTLQIPIPAEAPQVPMQAAPPVAAPMPPQDPGMQQGPPQQIAASVLDYFDNYYGRRVANWLDAIEAGRGLNPAEVADYRRQAEKLSTLENGRDLSTTNRNPMKGTANMARSTIASRSEVARAGRRQHFAEGPHTDGGPFGEEDQGVHDRDEFITSTPPAEAGDFPTDDTNISNTEHNLVARVKKGRDQLLRDAQALSDFQRRRANETATVVDPTVQTGAEGEALTGTDFVSADPNDGVVPTNPKDASLRAFQAFDGWLAQKTGSSSRRHSEATIKKAAAQFSREAGISPQALFPALGIVLREARKNDKQANTKGAKMKKRSNESLDVAAPDGRVDVEAPVENVTSERAQDSQFDLHEFGKNAGDDIAKPDLSTDQNWAPGEAKTSAIKTAGGLLAMRCAEGMIAAGLEPNSRERKYQLAAEFENMNRGLIQDRVALLERFAAVRQADLRKVASGSSRGAARSPIPAGLGGGTRTAAAGPRTAAHDPSNDSTLFI